jgi:hypothetical protein
VSVAGQQHDRLSIERARLDLHDPAGRHGSHPADLDADLARPGAVVVPHGDAIAFERNAADFSSVALWVMRPDGSDLWLIKDNARAPRWSSATR